MTVYATQMAHLRNIAMFIYIVVLGRSIRIIPGQEQSCLNCIIGCDDQTKSCSGCVSGYWGERCENKCPQNCSDIGCSQNSGKCYDCLPGHIGEFCEGRCQINNCHRCVGETDLRPEECWSCIVGWFGDECNHRCPEHCGDEWCDHFSGDCRECKGGWFGDKCEFSCFENCIECEDDHTCRACKHGFYGSNCEHKCPDGCKTCSRDGSECITCLGSNKKGLNCECSISSDFCDGNALNGYCQSCKTGYTKRDGYGCCPNVRYNRCLLGNSTAECKTCKEGFFGDACTYTCSPYCSGNNCNKQTGKCTNGCLEGWYGPKCNVHCATHFPHCENCETSVLAGKETAVCKLCESGFFGNAVSGCYKCKHCIDNLCDPHTGHCVTGCLRGWYKDRNNICSIRCDNCIDETCYQNGTCVHGCKTGFFLDKCTIHCHPHCYNDTCDHWSGACIHGCDSGYFGAKCRKLCDYCLDGACNQTSGVCEACDIHHHGPFCQYRCDDCVGGVCVNNIGCLDGCKLGKYGRYCNYSCSSKNKACVACEQSTGTCTVCENNSDLMSDMIENCTIKDTVDWKQWLLSQSENETCELGMYGVDCMTECPKTCKRRNDFGKVASPCDRFTGACLIDGCHPGYYGLYCERKCHEHCGEDDEGRHPCDRFKGTCPRGCEFGWEGETCEQRTLTLMEQRKVEDYSKWMYIGIGVAFAIVLSIGGITIVIIIQRKRNAEGYIEAHQR